MKSESIQINVYSIVVLVFSSVNFILNKRQGDSEFINLRFVNPVDNSKQKFWIEFILPSTIDRN